MRKKISLVIFLGTLLFLIGYKVLQIHTSNKYATLLIPKINLESDFYLKDSKDNDVDKGLYLLDESIYLENEYSKMIIASHSGSASISYFKNLDELDINDEIIIKKDNVTYYYQVINKYYEEKDGSINILEDGTSYVALITCTKGSDDTQTVLIGTLRGKIEEI